ncbi:MAG: hypothetical protein QW279_11570 [Candidatus Jordarchaeaceae archaeon]
MITLYLKDELNSSLSELGKFVVDFRSCGNTDMYSGIKEILKANPLIKDEYLSNKIDLYRGLYVDIIGVIHSLANKRSELIICEVKSNKLTLTDHAQLIGYCVASNVKLGLLIALGGRITGDFESILNNNPALIKIVRKDFAHLFGICSWDPSSKELLFDDKGAFKSLTALSRKIASNLEKVI